MRAYCWPGAGMVYPFATVVMSIVSGLLGYKYAISQQPAGVKIYLLAVSIGTLAQVMVLALASNRRDRLINASNVGRLVNVRLRLGVTLAWIVSIAAGALYLASDHQAAGFVALIFMCAALQYSTYSYASKQQVRNQPGYWRIQFYGAVTRLLSVTVLVIVVGWGYVGILVANMLAAGAICWQYGCIPLPGRQSAVQLVRGIRVGGKRLVTWDGLLRAAKVSYESLAIFWGAMLVEAFAGLSQQSTQAMYAAVGYVNTVSTSLRQVLASWELNIEKGPSATAVTTVLVSTALLAVLLQYQYGMFDLLLPQMPPSFLLDIVMACGVFVVLFPLTRGYLFVDYLDPGTMQRIALSLLITLPLSAMVVLIVTRILGDQGAPLWAAIAPLSIAMGMRVRRA